MRTHHMKKLIAFGLGAAMFLAIFAVANGGSFTTHIEKSDDQFRHITYCASGEEVESQCKDIQHFRVLKSADLSGPRGTYFTNHSMPNESFYIRLENSGFLRPDTIDVGNTVEVSFRITSRSISEELEIVTWTSRIGGKEVHRDYGALVGISTDEADPEGMGFELLVPKDSDLKSYVDCAKPFRAKAGNMVTDVGCRVFVQVYKNVILTYPIYRRDIQSWATIHAQILEQFRNVMALSDERHLNHVKFSPAKNNLEGAIRTTSIRY